MLCNVLKTSSVLVYVIAAINSRSPRLETVETRRHRAFGRSPLRFMCVEHDYSKKVIAAKERAKQNSAQLRF